MVCVWASLPCQTRSPRNHFALFFSACASVCCPTKRGRGGYCCWGLLRCSRTNSPGNNSTNVMQVQPCAGTTMCSTSMCIPWSFARCHWNHWKGHSRRRGNCSQPPQQWHPMATARATPLFCVSMSHVPVVYVPVIMHTGCVVQYDRRRIATHLSWLERWLRHCLVRCPSWPQMRHAPRGPVAPC